MGDKTLKSFLACKRSISAIILFYILLAIFNINYPGLNTDETFNGVVSTNILKDAVTGKTQILNRHLVLFGRIFPVTASEYYGPIVPYLIYPFIRTLGLNTISLRLSSIFILAIFLFFVYQLCKLWFGERVGFLATLLTATNLVFVQHSRVGLFRGEIFVMAFFWLGLSFLAKYSENRKYLFLFLSFFFFGLSLNTKITFLYYAVGLILAYLIIGRRFDLLGILNTKKVIVILFSFCLGSFLLIVYNIIDPWVNFKQLFSAMTDINSAGLYTTAPANNSHYLRNLGTRSRDAFTILSGDISSRLDWGVVENSNIEIISPLITGLALISLVTVIFLALFSSSPSKIIRYRILFLYIIYVSVFFLTPFTLSAFNQGHLLILLPFPQITMAIFLGYILEKAEQRKLVFVKLFGWFLITAALLFNIWMNIYFNIQMKRTGGYGRWSTAIVELTDYLKKNKITSPVMFGYGLHTNLIFLSGNEVVPQIYDKFYPKPIIPEYKRLFSEKKPIFFLTFTPDGNELEDLFANGSRSDKKTGLKKDLFCMLYMRFMKDENVAYRDLFMKSIQESGKKKELEKVFLNRSGQPVYWLYKIY